VPALFWSGSWNGRDPILKERLFGLTGPEGNHGEDVKENYCYLDATPTYSYAKALYKYPQGEFPYQRLIEENQGRRPEKFANFRYGSFPRMRCRNEFLVKLVCKSAPIVIWLPS
jgi:hypothetical protein